MAQLLRAGREGSGHREDRPQLVHVAHRGAVLALRRAPGARVRRRPAADGASLLHEFCGARPQEEIVPRLRMVVAGAVTLSAGVVAGYWLSRASAPAIDARPEATPVSDARAPRPSTPAPDTPPPASPAAPRPAIAANAAAYLAQRYAIDRTAAFDRL